MSKVSEGLLAIQEAFDFLREGREGDSTASLPTAKVRAALDLLSDSTAQSLEEDEVNLRDLCKDLFEWTGGTRVNRPLIQTVQDALTTKGKYSHAVEVIAFAAACVPLLEPDRLARLITNGLKDVDTAFAPAKYTLQLAQRIYPIFSQYSVERQERLLTSLWVQSHKGRWWDLTDGQGDDDAAVDNGDEYSRAELQDALMERELSWNPRIAEQVSKLRRNKDLLEALDDYNADLLSGKAVDPDIAVLASHIPWLTPNERPESPVGGLLDYLNTLMVDLEIRLPKKPKKFSDLFPNIALYGESLVFPFPRNVFQTDSKELMPGVKMEIVKNAAQLAENRTYMGNCTWSYKGQMEKGTYVLYRLYDEQGSVYNASMVAGNNAWRMGEIEGRHAMRNIPGELRRAFQQFTSSVEFSEADAQQIAQRERLQTLQQKKYRHTL